MKKTLTMLTAMALITLGGGLWAGDGAINLGPNVNSIDDDFGPIVTASGNDLYFTSTRDGGQGGQDIWVSHRANGAWQPATNLGAPINTKFHEGPDSFSVDDKTMYFTRCDKLGQPGICDIYTAAWDDAAKTWGNVKPLGPNVNSNYDDSNGSISFDGKTLYFISNRPGDAAKVKECGDSAGSDADKKKGDFDVFVSKWDDKTKDWGPASRLPAPVNTCGAELQVVIQRDNQTLYFSSNGMKGVGGADIWMSKIADGKFQTPVNMGEPINTADDDVYFSIPASGELAYLASDRPGTVGLMDIFSVPIPVKVNETKGIVIVKGLVADKASCKDAKDPRTCTPIPKIKVQAKDSAGALIKEATSQTNGLYNLPLPIGAKLTLLVEAPGFKPLSILIDAEKMKPYATVEQNLLLEKN
jgi:hypothetical protein